MSMSLDKLKSKIHTEKIAQAKEWGKGGRQVEEYKIKQKFIGTM